MAAALTLAGFLLIGQGGWIPQVGGPGLYRAGSYAIALAFAIRVVGEFRYVGLFKSVTGTRFARLDTLCFTPLCASLALAAFVVARY